MVEERFDACEVAFGPSDEELGEAAGVGGFEVDGTEGGEERGGIGVAAFGGELGGDVAGRAEL
jgi:hypothetical protein